MSLQTYIAHIRVSLHPWVLASTSNSLRLSASPSVAITSVTVGKYFKVELKAPHHPAACNEVEAICKELLVNPIIETFEYGVVQKAGS